MDTPAPAPGMPTPKRLPVPRNGVDTPRLFAISIVSFHP